MKKIKIKNKEVLEIMGMISRLQENELPLKFSYGLSKNSRILEPETKTLQEAMKPDEKFLEYDKKRVDLAKKHASKDKKGKPIVNDNQYQLENEEKFESEFENLKEKHKDTIEKQKQKQDEMNDLLEQETEISAYQISIKSFPQKIIGNYLKILLPFIKEKDQEIESYFDELEKKDSKEE